MKAASNIFIKYVYCSLQYTFLFAFRWTGRISWTILYPDFHVLNYCILKRLPAEIPNNLFICLVREKFFPFARSPGGFLGQNIFLSSKSRWPFFWVWHSWRTKLAEHTQLLCSRRIWGAVLPFLHKLNVNALKPTVLHIHVTNTCEVRVPWKSKRRILLFPGISMSSL